MDRPQGLLLFLQWRALPMSNKLIIKVCRLTIAADGLYAIGAAVIIVVAFGCFERCPSLRAKAEDKCSY
jgi:hypothetical protein